MPKPGLLFKAMRPFFITGSGPTKSRRSGESKTIGEIYSKRGIEEHATCKWQPQAVVIPVFQPWGMTSAP